jgi:Sulfatase
MYRQIAKLIALAAFVLGYNLCFAEQNPNIVLIFADAGRCDDHRCHGHPSIKTTNLDRLARNGTDFDLFTVASAVCSQSRRYDGSTSFAIQYSQSLRGF